MDDLDPTTVKNLDDLTTLLKLVHIKAAALPYRTLEHQTDLAHGTLPGTRTPPLRRTRLTRSTLSDMLSGRKHVAKAFMLSFLEACGIDIGNDSRWDDAWERVAFQQLYPRAKIGMEQPRRQRAETEATPTVRTVHDISERRQELDGQEDPTVLRPGTVRFWDALDRVEREALGSLASWRTFAAGTALMEEGEPADNVIVILGGQVEIRVKDNDQERVLTVRGLGDLVGERAALRVSIRSATVVALEMVWALVIQTRDFAAFIMEHPRVLDIVQNIIQQRHTEGPTGYDSPPLISDNCTVFLTDVVGFGDRIRAAVDHSLIREALFNMTRATVAGIANARIVDRGDGFMTVVPPDVPAATIIDRIFKELPAALDRHNRTQRETARFQLRLAVTIGPVVTDIVGVSGEATIIAARLVEASDFKAALAGSSASLGVIASPFVYEAVIRHGMDPAELETYQQTPVAVKELTTTAWMKLVSHKLGSV